jgi:stearoyl-CoA desaturase (delta-9 desaturase)
VPSPAPSIQRSVGERRFEIPGAAETGTNLWLLGVLSFGEGFHNNHHALPRSAWMGMRGRKLDLGWLVIRALEALRIVRSVAAWHRAGAPPPAGTPAPASAG